MDIVEQFSYPGPAGSLPDLIQTARWRDDLAQALGGEVRSDDDDAPRYDLVLPSPADLTSLVGATIELVVRIDWDTREGNSCSGRLSVDVSGLPAGLEGTISARSESSDDGATVEMTGEFRVNVPLLGASLERKAAPTVQEVLSAFRTATQQWFADNKAG